MYVMYIIYIYMHFVVNMHVVHREKHFPDGCFFFSIFFLPIDVDVSPSEVDTSESEENRPPLSPTLPVQNPPH